MSFELDIFRAKLAAFREKYNLSFQELADNIGVTRGAYL